MYNIIKILKGGIIMVDFIRNNIDRIIRAENEKVNGLNKTSIIHKESESRNHGRGQKFDEELKKRKSVKRQAYNMERRSEKELLESNIIVESSLNKELEKNRRISELVNEKFVNNEELKGQIDFEIDEKKDEIDETDRALREVKKYNSIRNKNKL